MQKNTEEGEKVRYMAHEKGDFNPDLDSIEQCTRFQYRTKLCKLRTRPLCHESQQQSQLNCVLIFGCCPFLQWEATESRTFSGAISC